MGRDYTHRNAARERRERRVRRCWSCGSWAYDPNPCFACEAAARKPDLQENPLTQRDSA